MADQNDRVLMVGEQQRLPFDITLQSAGVISQVRAYIRSWAGSTSTVVVDAGVGTVNGGLATPSVSAVSHTAEYLWAPADAGDYISYVDYTVGSQTFRLPQRMAILVWSAASKYEPWLDLVNDWLDDEGPGTDAAHFSLRDYKKAVDAAVLAYSGEHPKQRRISQAFTANDWNYSLTNLTGWVNGFSDIIKIEPRIDATIQSRSYIEPLGWVVDEEANEWYFTNHSPSTGETGYIWFTRPWTLSHTTDEVPTDQREWISCFAAGMMLLGPGSARSARTNSPQQGAELADYGTQHERMAVQGEKLLKHARRQWAMNRRPVIDF